MTGARDVDLLAFASRWADHGGGPADQIAEIFGVSQTEFFTRILRLTDESAELDEARRRRLRRVARLRLWLCSA